MGKEVEQPKAEEPVAKQRPESLPLPRPTPQFRRRAWREFQRALDPLAPPKPLRGAGRS